MGVLSFCFIIFFASSNARANTYDVRVGSRVKLIEGATCTSEGSGRCCLNNDDPLTQAIIFWPESFRINIRGRCNRAEMKVESFSRGLVNLYLQLTVAGTDENFHRLPEPTTVGTAYLRVIILGGKQFAQPRAIQRCGQCAS